VYGIETKEVAVEGVTNELNVDPALEIVSNEFECPKVERLFAEANRVFNREEPEVAVEEKNKKGGKGGAAPKKDDKKQGKKK
jgi:hypothetical protein